MPKTLGKLSSEEVSSSEGSRPMKNLVRSYMIGVECLR